MRGPSGCVLAALVVLLVACDDDSVATSAPLDAGRALDSAGEPSAPGDLDSGTVVGPGPDASASANLDGGTDDDAAACGFGDENLPPEPTIPPACATLAASLAVVDGGVPSEAAFDTARIQSALDKCAAGQAVRLVPTASFNAFLVGPLTVPAGVTLWVDSGATLYGTRDPKVYATAPGLITVNGAGSGIVGDGVIDGQGGEPKVGATESFWDDNGDGGQSPALIDVEGASRFTLYRITLQNSPMFHVKLGAAGFVAWGVTIKTPSKAVNSVGTPLTPSSAHNTDGIDPGEAASDGFIVCSRISDGDDHIAIKGGVGVKNVTIAHNHFEAGHGMSIGSETNGGVSNIRVYDLSIDGTGTGLTGGDSVGLRIKSDPSRGGLVEAVTYEDVCTRAIENPILVSPHYSSDTGTLIPSYQGIVVRDFHALAASKPPTVTLEGYDAAHASQITLDNVVVDGLASGGVTAAYANVTLGPGAVNFVPSGVGVTVATADGGASMQNSCAGKWVTF